MCLPGCGMFIYGKMHNVLLTFACIFPMKTGLPSPVTNGKTRLFRLQFSSTLLLQCSRFVEPYPVPYHYTSTYSIDSVCFRLDRLVAIHYVYARVTNRSTLT